MNSPDPPKNWNNLTARARQVPAPGDLDVRHAIRARMATQTPAPLPAASSGMLEDLLALGRARWLQSGLACITAFAGWSCWQSVAITHELAAIWSLGGPLTGQL